MRSLTAVFAADLHLKAADPAGIARAVGLLRTCRARTGRLFLLGDVFDLWISDALFRLDEMQALYRAFAESARDGLRIDFLPGNRDFNLTREDGRRLGFEVHGEVLSIELGGRRLCLTHGDRFLLRDRGYQRLKAVIRSRPLRWVARHVPAPVTLALARRLRGYSDRAVRAKAPERLEIVPDAVKACLRDHDLVLCGHVHRAERVDFGGGRELCVLPAFLESGRFLALRDGEMLEGDLEGELRPFAPPPGPTRT